MFGGLERQSLKTKLKPSTDLLNLDFFLQVCMQSGRGQRGTGNGDTPSVVSALSLVVSL